MATRRDLLKYGMVAGGSSLLLSRSARAQRTNYLQYLCPPDNQARDLADQPPSPAATPFKDKLFIPPVMTPMNAGHPGVDVLSPHADPNAHQRYDDFKPTWFFEIHEKEFEWQFHSDAPYNTKSMSWGWQGRTADGWLGRGPSAPGPTYHAKYGEPILTRLYNSLPPVGQSKVTFALPSTTTHLHNGHTASESDGNPQDWIDSGEFWDHHYGNFPSGMDPREKLTTLWYHDHRMDFTAANVYAGLFGFYLLFDENDTGNENDKSRDAWRLPSGDYDVPLIIQDIQFRPQMGEDGQIHAQANFQNWNTDGMIGDMMTVNRIIMPHFKVEPRKYRFRVLNGGPSRFYQICLRGSRKVSGTDRVNFTVITGDGNFLPEPVIAENLYMSVAQRYDVIVDFSAYKPGDTVTMYNLLEQTNGRGPTSRLLDPGEIVNGRHVTELMQFQVVESTGKDNSRVPDYFRPLPTYDLKDVKRHRTWNFDYDGGLWTINGQIFDPNRIDAGIDQGSLEIWTMRNGGSDWSHPIHSHFTEFILLEVNGKDVAPRAIEDAFGRQMSIAEYLGTDKPPPVKIFMGGSRRDVATILPNDEIKGIMQWNDFLGKHVMHCHNVVHEDHAMMIRWDIMEPGRGFDGPRQAEEVYGPNGPEPVPWPDPRPPSKHHQEIHPSNPVQSEG